MEAESILTSRPEALRAALLEKVRELTDTIAYSAGEASNRWSEERRDMLALYVEQLDAVVEALGQFEAEGAV